jgi:hypothetical protein
VRPDVSSSFTTTRAPTVATSTGIPQAAVNALKQNPNLLADFEAKYGKGSASQYLVVNPRERR